MIVGAFAVVVVAGVAMAVSAAWLVGNHPGDRPLGGGMRLGVGLALPAVVTAGLIVVVLLLLAVVGFGRSGQPREDEPARASTDNGAGEPVALTGPAAAADAVVRVDATTSSLRPGPVVSGVSAGAVVEVRGRGFSPNSDGVIAQCRTPRSTRCANVLGIRTDDQGRVRSLYRLDDDVRGEMLLVAEVDFERGESVVVVDAPAPARPMLSLDGRGPERTVSVAGVRPGAALTVLQCAVGAEFPDECGTVERLAVAGDGRASALLSLQREPTFVAIVDAAGLPLVDPALVAARPGPRVEPDGARLAAGLALALALVGIAVALVRSTDWRPPAEASTPFLDTLTDA